MKMIKCYMCENEATVGKPHEKKRYAETGRAYCSRACSRAYQSRCSSVAMAKTNRKYASARMTANNPTRSAKTRAKISATLRARGHVPKVRGGNGRPPTEAEERLAVLLSGLGFVNQTIVPTGKGSRALGLPTHYKVDCGNTPLKIGVEADGSSHGTLARQAQDQRKDTWLRGEGWTVLRFKNAEIMNNPQLVMDEVLSIILRLKSSIPT